RPPALRLFDDRALRRALEYRLGNIETARSFPNTCCRLVHDLRRGRSSPLEIFEVTGVHEKERIGYRWNASVHDVQDLYLRVGRPRPDTHLIYCGITAGIAVDGQQHSH